MCEEFACFFYKNPRFCVENFESKFPYQRKADKQICYTAIFQKYKNLAHVEWKLRKAS